MFRWDVMGLSDAEMYDRMKNGWKMGLPFTVCGNGSTLEATKNAREWLPKIAKQYSIVTVSDAGAGDMAWIRSIHWDVDYTPYDLVPRLDEVIKFDITKDILPAADLILCRMVLNHIQENIDSAVERIKESGSAFLIATQFDNALSRTRQFQRLDLRLYFGDYIESVQDGNEEACKLALWSIH